MDENHKLNLLLSLKSLVDGCVKITDKRRTLLMSVIIVIRVALHLGVKLISTKERWIKYAPKMLFHTHNTSEKVSQDYRGIN